MQENTGDPKAGSRDAAVKTYQKASEVLVALAAENPDDARAIINKVLLALKARKAAKALKLETQQ